MEAACGKKTWGRRRALEFESNPHLGVLKVIRGGWISFSCFFFCSQSWILALCLAC
jgi:hypothetical protein